MKCWKLYLESTVLPVYREAFTHHYYASSINGYIVINKRGKELKYYTK